MRLLDEGVSQADVARELDVSRQTVSRWVRLKEAYPDHDAWRRRQLGRPGGLTDEQKMSLVRRLVDICLGAFGPKGRSSPRPVRWTLARVARLMEVEFGTSYSVTQVRNILIGLVGDDQWLLSKPRFWACIIELAYPEYVGEVLVEDFVEGWTVSSKVIAELRRRRSHLQ
jgi:transposase